MKANCKDCGKPIHAKKNCLCRACYFKHPELQPMWNGGRKVTDAGYIVAFSPKHPKAHRDGYVFEHRLVMEQHIGRFLKESETVHHKNGNPADNRVENLLLCHNQAEHFGHHREPGCKMCGKLHYARGMCVTHYNKWKWQERVRLGTTQFVKGRYKKPKTAPCLDCSKIVRVEHGRMCEFNGLCRQCEKQRRMVASMQSTGIPAHRFLLRAKMWSKPFAKSVQ